MAVEVIGKDDSKYRKVTCDNCGSILRYLPNDVQNKSVYSFGESEVVSYIVCPECERLVYPRRDRDYD